MTDEELEELEASKAYDEAHEAGVAFAKKLMPEINREAAKYDYYDVFYDAFFDALT